MNGNQPSLREILRNWIEGVNEMRLGEVAALYAEEAVLIPTFSSSIYNSETEIAGYFSRITDQREVSVTVREETVVEQVEHVQAVDQRTAYGTNQPLRDAYPTLG